MTDPDPFDQDCIEFLMGLVDRSNDPQADTVRNAIYDIESGDRARGLYQLGLSKGATSKRRRRKHEKALRAYRDEHFSHESANKAAETISTDLDRFLATHNKTRLGLGETPYPWHSKLWHQFEILRIDLKVPGHSKLRKILAD